MALCESALRQPGDRLTDRQTAAERPPAGTAVTTSDIPRREIPSGQSVVSANPDAPVPVMERPGEPGRRLAVVTIDVSETDAEWWFG
jgi:hypothetical protein